MGCQTSKGCIGRVNQGYLLQVIPPVLDIGRDVVVLAVVGEGLLVEGHQDGLDLLLEEVPVGLGVQQRRAEGLDLSGLVAAPHAKGNPSPGEDVGRSVVLGQAQWMPVGGDVEGATEP